MKVTILGCGGSTGVPMVTGNWGLCDPSNIKNYRRRPSVLIETTTPSGEQRNILIDTSPDLREQLLRADVKRIDAVLFTHTHADHTHGIDDLRVLTFFQGPLQAYAERLFLDELATRFPYVFYGGKSAIYKPILIPNIIDGAFEAVGISIQSFKQFHGDTYSTGFRIGNFAYSIDVMAMPEDSLALLNGITHWVVDCQQIEPHPTHAYLPLTLDWIGRVKPKLAVLSHMGPKLDYDSLRIRLPKGVEPGFDGMSFTI